MKGKRRSRLVFEIKIITKELKVIKNENVLMKITFIRRLIAHHLTENKFNQECLKKMNLQLRSCNMVSLMEIELGRREL